LLDVFLVENEIFHELESVDEYILKIYMLRCVFLVSHLLEGNRLVGKGAKAGLLTGAIFGVLSNELPFIA